MNIKNNLLILGLFFTTCSFGMKRKHEGPDVSERPLKRQKIERSIEEQKFILNVKKWEKDKAKLASLKIVIKEILASHSNTFIAKIETAIIKNSLAKAFTNAITLSPEIHINDVTAFQDKNKNVFSLEVSNENTNNIKLSKMGDEKELSTLTSQAKVKAVKFCKTDNFALSLGELNGDKILQLWDLRNKSNPLVIGSIKNWVDSIAYLDCSIDLTNPKNSFIFDKKSENVWDLKPYLFNLGEIFKNLYSETTNINDRVENTGIIKYLLINAIIDHKNVSHVPFEISYPRLKQIFNLLPDIIKQAFTEQGYVKLS